jgi:hypothetical protein
LENDRQSCKAYIQNKRIRAAVNSTAMFILRLYRKHANKTRYTGHAL